MSCCALLRTLPQGTIRMLNHHEATSTWGFGRFMVKVYGSMTSMAPDATISLIVSVPINERMGALQPAIGSDTC